MSDQEQPPAEDVEVAEPASDQALEDQGLTDPLEDPGEFLADVEDAKDPTRDYMASRIAARVRQGKGGEPGALTWERFKFICATVAETGAKYKSCEAGGFKYQTVLDAMNVQRNNGNEEWWDLWQLSYEHHRESLAVEARRRAVDGYKEPIFGKGGEVKGYLRKKSDRLLELMLKGHFPEVYRDNVHVTGQMDLNSGGLDIIADLSHDAKKRIRAIILEDIAARSAKPAASPEGVPQ